MRQKLVKYIPLTGRENADDSEDENSASSFMEGWDIL